MPWFAMINQSEAAKQASKELNVEYIPSLVIIDPSGNVISKEGVDESVRLKRQQWDYGSRPPRIPETDLTSSSFKSRV